MTTGPPEPPAARDSNRPSVALALGGGGARGLAHILMLEALDEMGIKPTLIVGTSIGAIFGAAYASGLSAKLIRAHTEEVLGQRLSFVQALLSARAEPVQRLLNLLPIRASLLSPRLLLDQEVDVRRAVSFAFRLAGRGETGPVHDALARHVPPKDPAATWVLCDTIRSMATKLLPEFVPLLPQYERWAAAPALDARERRSVESAVKTLRKAAQTSK